MLWWPQKTKSFFDHFESHAQEILAGSVLLQKLFQETPSSAALAISIKRHEHRADQVTHEVMNQLNSTFIYPIDREDILALTKTLDDVMDGMHHAAQAFHVIFHLPEGTPFAYRFVQIIRAMCERLTGICALLRKPSKHLYAIRKECVEIHRLENEGDELLRQSLHNLFEQLQSEKIHVSIYLAWSEIYKLLELVTDQAEDCANIIEQIAMKYN